MNILVIVQKPHILFWFIAGLLIGLLTPASAADSPTATREPFVALQQRLARDGFNRSWVEDLYRQPGVAFEKEGVALFFMHSEAKLNYAQFTKPANIEKARRYMDTHAEALAAAEKKYQVDPCVITAILLVETRLGGYTGHRSILNTLSTMAALSDQTQRDQFYQALPAKRRLAREQYEKKADQKAEWAYRELKAFLEYTRKEQIDPLRVNGSYAGAVGIAQFMPSNILHLGRDGNADGAIDLFDHPDAIASTANYLKHHGWKPGLTSKQAYKVILRYNYSSYYANTVLKIAKRLKG
jgi:membrane-bound lytic murein transglycosylase B